MSRIKVEVEPSAEEKMARSALVERKKKIANIRGVLENIKGKAVSLEDINKKIDIILDLFLLSE